MKLRPINSEHISHRPRLVVVGCSFKHFADGALVNACAAGNFSLAELRTKMRGQLAPTPDKQIMSI